MSGGKPFELGLVMAGAVSAGAYTAGVVDFLLEALDHWEKAKRADEARGGAPTVPHHKVVIKAMSGASAGAITAAITAAALFAEHAPATDPKAPPPPGRNRLYDCWVEQIDIGKLLGSKDLGAFGEVVSLLDSTALAVIGQRALVLDARADPPRRFVADPLALFLTVSNLRGVPYAFSLFGERERKFGMNCHMDDLRFAISPDLGRAKPALGLPGMQPLDPLALFEEGPSARRRHWDLLVTAALASGAFPVGLQPRMIERPGSDYEPQPYSKLHTAPGWDEEPWVYRFLAVDGGLMSNEPMALARSYIAAEVDPRQEQSGLRAAGALILIDPFPNEIHDYREYWPNRSLTSVLAQMFTALKSQARFNAEDLELAADPEVYNRFAISPSRIDDTGNRREPAIASGIMGGFGGFFSRSFRRHDFHLGRRNCQAFLARYFALPETNPLFNEDNFPPPLRAAFYVRDRSGARREVRASKAARGGQPHPLLPVIPLLPPLDRPLPVPDWPTPGDVNLVDLTCGVEERVRRVGALLIERELRTMLGPVTTALAKAAWHTVLAGRVSAAVMRVIERELRRLQ